MGGASCKWAGRIEGELKLAPGEFSEEEGEGNKDGYWLNDWLIDWLIDW
jgi:hypothetical protein